MPKYAQYTKVPVHKSLGDIETFLKRYGANGFMHGYEDDRATISFKWENRVVLIRLNLPESEQEVRQRYRALLLTVKAKLECIDSGIETFEEAFLAHLVLPDGKTIGERFANEYREMLESGQELPPLIPEIT